jgi:hypothetical protein
VVHHEDHAGIPVHRGKPLFVREAHTYPVQNPRGLFRDPVADPEVGVRVEGGHDLLRVTLDLRHHDVSRDVVLLRVGARRLHDFRVVHQPVDQHLSLGQGERADIQLEALPDLFEHQVDATAKEPADARDQQAAHGRPRREEEENRGEPDGKGNVSAHRSFFP